MVELWTGILNDENVSNSSTIIDKLNEDNVESTTSKQTNKHLVAVE
jgi:hypothetical protein